MQDKTTQDLAPSMLKPDSFTEFIIGTYERDKNSFPSGANPVIINLRERALNVFAERGFPGRRSEYYKYSPVQPLVKAFGLSVDSESFDKQQFIVDAASINVFIVDGKFDSIKGESPEGLSIGSMALALNSEVSNKIGSIAKVESDEMIALNSLLFVDGAVIQITKSQEKAIHVFYISTTRNASFNFPRSLITVADNTEATIIEHSVCTSEANYFSIPLTEIIVGKSSKVEHYRIQEDGNSSNVLTSTHAIQKKESFFSTHTFTLSGSYTRNNLNIILDDEHCESVLNGLFVGKDKQHVDNHTFVDHRMPNCLSNEIYKGIAGDRSTGVFNGKIMVRQDAQKTNAYQSNKNILLSPDATINTKPQLEIYADDVKCSHGSTTGMINQEALFYLQARGISKNSAIRLMLHAFASELTDEIKPEKLREYVSSRVNSLLEK